MPYWHPWHWFNNNNNNTSRVPERLASGRVSDVVPRLLLVLVGGPMAVEVGNWFVACCFCRATNCKPAAAANR
jgi:hypothetical protein